MIATAFEARQAIEAILAGLPDGALPLFHEREGTLWFSGHGWPVDEVNSDDPRKITRGQVRMLLDAEAAVREIERRAHR